MALPRYLKANVFLGGSYGLPNESFRYNLNLIKLMHVISWISSSTVVFGVSSCAVLSLSQHGGGENDFVEYSVGSYRIFILNRRT